MKVFCPKLSESTPREKSHPQTSSLPALSSCWTEPDMHLGHHQLGEKTGGQSGGVNGASSLGTSSSASYFWFVPRC